MENSESFPSGSNPVAGGMPKEKSTISRIFHFIMFLFYLALLTLAVVSLGTFATQHNKFKKQPETAGGCLLFVTYSEEGGLKVNHSHVCAFAIWGEAIVAVLAAVLGLLAVVKIIIGRRVVSLLAVAELVGIVVGTLLGLTIGIVISIGIRQTCDAVKDAAKEIAPPGTKCDDGPFPGVHASEVTAWIGTCVMFFLGVVYIVILIVYCMRTSKRRTLETFQPVSTEPPPTYLANPTDYPEYKPADYPEYKPTD